MLGSPHISARLGGPPAPSTRCAVRYFDDRDLIGFVDGTENPASQDAVSRQWIGAEDPAYAAATM